MKKVLLLLALVLLLVGNASAESESWKLGSHEVTLNLSFPANCSLDTPYYSKDTGIWAYSLNITPDSGGYVLVGVSELPMPIQGGIGMDRVAAEMLKRTTESGLGGVEYRTTTYKGHDAFEISNPAQVTTEDDWTYTWPETYTLMYQPDPYSGASVQATNTGEDIFRAVLDLIEIV